MRSSMMDALAEDYIRTARAKGASNERVLYGHALRNALIPILTLIGLSLPAIVGGALITETVFNYPGMGLLTVQAASNDDIPLVLGTTLVITVATVVGSLLADILYAVADPRIRFGSSTHDGRTSRRGPRLRHRSRPGPPLAHGVGLGETVAPLTWCPRAARPAQGGGMGIQILRVFVENKLAVVGLVIIVAHGAVLLRGPVACTTPTRPTQQAVLNTTRTPRPATATRWAPTAPGSTSSAGSCTAARRR